MGAAEARALWQRTASRCFVQEDARRAPKLACCQQQSSAASTKHIDLEPSGIIGLDEFSSGIFEDPSYYSNFQADTKWWLKRFTGQQQLNSLEREMEILKPGFMNSPFEDIKCKKMQEFVDLTGTREEYWFMETGISEKLNEMYFEPVESSRWVSSKKAEPWWRTTTDKDELALLVATKSLDYIENCDLPPPQKPDNRKHNSSGNPCCSNLISDSHVHEKGFHESVKTPRKQGVSGETENMEHRSERSFSCGSTKSKNSSLTRESKSPKNDLNKAELLEALRHSQTRAREAEKAAKEAYMEKEHIITLLFKQAAQLFAYKQWFQILQLEALYLQIKNSDKQISTLLPGDLPCKGRNQRTRWRKGKNGEIGRYMVAFALGFSLVGAGLLLGWTVGWLLPF